MEIKMNTPGKIRLSKVWILALFILCSATANDALGMAYDMSDRPPDAGIALGYDSKDPTLVCGIFRHEAKDGIVVIGNKSWLSPKGAGYFLAGKKRHYTYPVHGVVITNPAPGVYRKTNQKIIVSDLFFNAVVQDYNTLEYYKENKLESFTSCFVKPISGRINKLTISNSPVPLSDTDLSDGMITTQEGVQYQVYFLSRMLIHGQSCFLLPMSYTGKAPF